MESAIVSSDYDLSEGSICMCDDDGCNKESERELEEAAGTYRSFNTRVIFNKLLLYDKVRLVTDRTCFIGNFWSATIVTLNKLVKFKNILYSLFLSISLRGRYDLITERASLSR